MSGQLLRPRVDAKSRVCVRQCFYSVPVRYAGTRIDVCLGAEHVEALDGHGWSPTTPERSAKGSRPSISTTTSRRSPSSPGHWPGRPRCTRPGPRDAFSATHERFLRCGPAPPGRQGREPGAHRRPACAPRPALDAVVAGIEGALAVGSVDPDVVLVEARRATRTANAVRCTICPTRPFRPARRLSL